MASWSGLQQQMTGMTQRTATLLRVWQWLPIQLFQRSISLGSSASASHHVQSQYLRVNYARGFKYTKLNRATSQPQAPGG